MGFEGLLGNDRLKDNLTRSLQKDRGGHFYLISGPEGSGKHTLARLLAAALMCEQPNRPCCSCGPCRKVLSGVHPDYITVDDPEKKTVSVDLVRKARTDMYTLPNEGRRKIYLFPRAQDMGIPSQNALLKILEDPPAYGVFLLLTDNPQRLLPTVRSRCMELAMSPLPEAMLSRQLCQQFPQSDADTITAAISRSGGYLGQAMALLSGESEYPEQTVELINAYTSGNIPEICRVLVGMEKWKRDRLIPILQQWEALFAEALTLRSGGRAVSPLARQLGNAFGSDQLFKVIRELQKCILYAQGNVSPGAICGYLQWVLIIKGDNHG